MVESMQNEMTSDQTTHRLFYGTEAVLVWIGRT